MNAPPPKIRKKIVRVNTHNHKYFNLIRSKGKFSFVSPSAAYQISFQIQPFLPGHIQYRHVRTHGTNVEENYMRGKNLDCKNTRGNRNNERRIMNNR